MNALLVILAASLTQDLSSKEQPPAKDPLLAPAWWLTKPAEIRAYLETLQGVEVEDIGCTAGSRPIVAAAWGERETLPGRTSTSLASAIAGGDPGAFYGKGRRKRQVILFVGGAHGTEFDGTVAALNYLNILATGKDLVGRDQPRMAEEGRKHRFIVIPFLNVDGRERALDRVHFIGCGAKEVDRVAQGVRKDGQILRWPASKLSFPIPREEVETLGTYFNDAGVNLVYDTTFAGESQPETTALLGYCRKELPDLVILSHSNAGSLVSPPSAFIPSTSKQRVDQIAAVVGSRCAREGRAKFAIPQSTRSPADDHFYQSDAVYHASGALPIVVEFPCGWNNVPPSFLDILDIGLSVLDELAIFGNRYRFRPKEGR